MRHVTSVRQELPDRSPDSVQRRWTISRSAGALRLRALANRAVEHEVRSKGNPPMNILDSLTGARADGPPRDETFADLGLPPTICKAIAAAGHHRTIPDPGGGHPRRPRRPRRVRPCSDRLGQDARVRPAARRPPPRRPPPGARRPDPRPHPRARRADLAGPVAVRRGARPQGRDRLRRRRLRRPTQAARPGRRVGRGVPRPPRGPVEDGRPAARPGRPRSSSTRPTRWPTWASCRPCAASSARPPPNARCCCSRRRSRARSPSSSSDFQDDPCLHEVGEKGPDITAAQHLFWLAERTDRPRHVAGVAAALGSTLVFCSHPPRRRPPRQATRQVRHEGRGDPRRSQPGAARSRPRGVQARQDRGAHRHRRRGARRPRRRHRVRVALRPAGRRRPPITTVRVAPPAPAPPAS